MYHTFIVTLCLKNTFAKYLVAWCVTLHFTAFKFGPIVRLN